MQACYDVVIAGGGMVGATLACALGNSGLKVAIIESAEPAPFASDQPPDLRVSALSAASQNILTHLNVWQGVTERRVCPYRRMKVWEMNAEHAATLFNAQEGGFSHLGTIVENRILQLALLERLISFDNVDLIMPVQVEKIDYSPGASLLELSDGRQLVARLLVAADGGDSPVRQQAGLSVMRRDYNQHALVATVETAYPQQDITWQQFTPAGPRAFLPLSGHYGSLVWYDRPETIAQLKSLSHSDLLQAFQQSFPRALGEVTQLLERGSFPLRSQHALQYVKEGVALTGDAAHMINPLAGQGVNIGLLDAAQLAEVLLEGKGAGCHPGDLTILKRYEKKRKAHNLLMLQSMDFFYHLFGNDILPLKLARNAGLGLADKLKPAKRKVIAFAMGLEGDLPALAKTAN